MLDRRIDVTGLRLLARDEPGTALLANLRGKRLPVRLPIASAFRDEQRVAGRDQNASYERSRPFDTLLARRAEPWLYTTIGKGPPPDGV